jgi:hypothetical protein
MVIQPDSSFRICNSFALYLFYYQIAGRYEQESGAGSFRFDGIEYRFIPIYLGIEYAGLCPCRIHAALFPEIVCSEGYF